MNKNEKAILLIKGLIFLRKQIRENPNKWGIHTYMFHTQHGPMYFRSEYEITRKIKDIYQSRKK